LSHFMSLLLRGRPCPSLFPYTTLFRSYGLVFDRAANKRSVLIASLLMMAISLGSIAWIKAFVPVLLLWMIQRAVSGPFFSTSEKDRKSTRLNSSHVKISYAVFCLKKYS